MKAKTKFTRLWSILLALAMVVGMLPTMVLAAGSATATADFSTDPTTALALLNDAKTGTTTSTWEGDTKTLTLGGVNFTTTAATAVKLPANTTIVLADGTTNTIKGCDSGSEDCYGIYVDNGNLTIQGETAGTGKLIVNGGNATGADKDSYGIRTEKGDVTITGGTVEVTGGAAVHKSSGIYAKRNDNGSGGYIGGNINISGSAQVTAAGGDVTDATSLSYGLFANAAMTISDSAKVTATGGASSNRSYGIRAYKGNVTISGTANVTATGGAADKISYGIGADDGDVTISGGAVIAKAGSADNIAAALNKAPTLTITAYSWRTLDSGDYYDPDYNWDESHTYVEIKSNPTVTFNANGENASVAPASGTTNAAGKLSTLPTPTRDGYTFKGWNTKQNGTGTTVTEETTFTENTTVYAQWEVATVSIPSVAITGIDAPVSNTALDTEAVCESAGVSNAQPTVTWDSEDDKAGYGKIYTTSITLTASEGYKFANSVTATVNGNPATSVIKNANGTLTVTYTFPATDKHNIEITVDTDVRDGDAAKNPTISSGYEIEFCFFVEDTDKDGVFINKTGNSITLDDKTLVVDKALVEAFAAQSGGIFTYESLMAVLKDEFDLDELKTEFTGGYDYSVLAYICHSDNAYFDSDDNQIVTNAIVKVNGKKITDNCLGFGGGMEIMPVAYVFSAAKTYTVSFAANGGTGTMADVTGISGEYTLPENGFTAPDGKQFKAWSVGGKEKAVGDKITVTADTTVKAVWENIPATPTEYDILDGANSSWTKDSDGNISVRGSGAFTKFVGVKVDGTLIDAKNYTVKEGSTVVILKADYLNTCTAGSHTLEIVWTDGSASTTFTVKVDSPQTGDNSMMPLWIALLFVSGFGVVATTVIGKKKSSAK